MAKVGYEVKPLCVLSKVFTYLLNYQTTFNLVYKFSIKSKDESASSFSFLV